MNEKIDRAQKLGNREQETSKVRPIVKCHNYLTRKSIRRKAYTLRNMLGEQIPEMWGREERNSFQT